MAYLPLDSSHPDYSNLAPIIESILLASRGIEEFQIEVPLILRVAIDEVIDSSRTGRFLLSETEQTEKTYLGTKVEILIRSYLGFSKGKILDMSIAGYEVDIKNTMRSNWSIPRENIGHPALLIRSNEATALCDVGVGLIREEYLRPGQNRDTKRGIAAANLMNVWWLLWQQPYPVNFWELLTDGQRLDLMGAGGGSARIAALFELIQRRPISRNQVQALAQQHDYMKRIRRNGGARDILAPKGIALLSGAYDHDLIKKLGLPFVTREEFISLKAMSIGEVEILKAAGHIN